MIKILLGGGEEGAGGRGGAGEGSNSGRCLSRVVGGGGH